MVLLGSKALTLDEVHRILYEDAELTLDSSALQNVFASHEFIKEFSQNKLIYGINTGFGPMAQYKISDANRVQLQYNLIRSHSAGAGKLLEPIQVKALMLSRLCGFMQGYSGVHTEVPQLLCDFINQNIYPCIYEHGGVGASGDLVQLAHLALVMIGEGEVLFNGTKIPATDMFAQTGLAPINIHVREGLAIINGTSAMTGIGLINIILSKKLLHWSCICAAIINELVSAFDDHLSPQLNAVKKHQGQNRIAGILREMIEGSTMIRHRPEHLYNENIAEVLQDKVQEYYSLRCIPQILGPILDTIKNAELTILDELNSVSDNPVIDHHEQNVYHGGNFHGDYVALEMDKLKTAITKLSMLSERQINYLMNDKLNLKFPPFLNLGKLGLNFGMQGVQFTATSTVAENQSLSFPMYVHSIPNNNDNQDIVSMGCNAAIMTAKVIDNTFEVLAIELMSLMQAMDYLNNIEKFSPLAQSVYNDLRAIFPKFIEDAPRYGDIERIKQFLKNSSADWTEDLMKVDYQPEQ